MRKKRKEMAEVIHITRLYGWSSSNDPWYLTIVNLYPNEEE